MKPNLLAQSMSIRAKANNLAKKLGIAPQAALQSYFVERFLARLAVSEYSSRMVVKGGTLMSALFGIAERTTMDIDTTLLGLSGDEASIRKVVMDICEIDASDGITFAVNESEPIAKDDEYGGYGFSLVASIGTIRLSLGIDVTVGDAITPAPERLEVRQMLDEVGCIRLWAYTTETLLAEKLQTLLKRGALSTRPRDFYDIHKIVTANRFRLDVLEKAIVATFRNRKSEELIPKRQSILENIRMSAFIHSQWERYRKQFRYASDITLDDALDSVRSLFACFPSAVVA